MREALDHIFAGRDRITLGLSYDRSFAQGWKRIDAGLGTWMRGLRDLRSASIGDKVAAAAPVALLAGAIGVVVGEVGAGRPYGFWTLLPAVAVLAGAGLVLTGASEELGPRTPRGNALWLRVEGFRRYLAGAGPRQAEETDAAGVLGGRSSVGDGAGGGGGGSW